VYLVHHKFGVDIEVHHHHKETNSEGSLCSLGGIADTRHIEDR
jgi:hypothetical protein